MFGFFLFYVLFQQCFVCLPSVSTVCEDAAIEPRTVATLALAARRSNHSARSHPQSARSHPPRLNLIHYRLDLIHTSSSTQSIPLGLFRIFSKIRGDIRKYQGAPPVSTTPVGKFSTGVNTPAAKLLPVSMIPAVNNGNNIRLQIP